MEPVNLAEQRLIRATEALIKAHQKGGLTPSAWLALYQELTAAARALQPSAPAMPPQ